MRYLVAYAFCKAGTDEHGFGAIEIESPTPITSLKQLEKLLMFQLSQAGMVSPGIYTPISFTKFEER